MLVLSHAMQQRVKRCGLDQEMFLEFSFILPVFEYCSPVWASAAESHLALLDRVVLNAAFMCPDIGRCYLGQRRDVASLYYILYN